MSNMSDDSPSAAYPLRSESPPAGRAKREGNESLWKRARRTLGTNQLTFLQPQNRPSGAAAPAPGSGPAPPNKRREQVRHAQRTHRQRTQNYIKTLESEVVRLRESEVKVVEERDKLQTQIENLKLLIVSANVPLPPDLVDPDDPNSAPTVPGFDFDMPARVSYSTADSLQHGRLHVQWPDRSPAQPNPASFASLQDQRQLPDFQESPYDFDSPPQDLPNDFSLNPLSVSSTASPSSTFPMTSPPFQKASPYSTPTMEFKGPVSSTDTLEVAIDFVLALEAPCMPHIPYPAQQRGDDPGSNHVMMMSAPLVAFAPQAPTPNSTWPASGAIIKELLNLSSSINLEGEMTPVEAWHRLHQHPEFPRLDRSAVEGLKRELAPAVRCCGFGAVLDEGVFWGAVNRCVAGARK